MWRRQLPGCARLHMDEGPLNKGIESGTDLALISRMRQVVGPAIIGGIGKAPGMVFEPPVLVVRKRAAWWGASAGDVFVNLAVRIHHAMKIRVAPRNFFQQRVRGHTATLEVHA